MAKRTPHRKADESRVYKASDVHKRRVDKSARPKPASRKPSKPVEDEPKRTGGRTQFAPASVDNREGEAPAGPDATGPLSTVDLKTASGSTGSQAPVQELGKPVAAPESQASGQGPAPASATGPVGSISPSSTSRIGSMADAADEGSDGQKDEEGDGRVAQDGGATRPKRRARESKNPRVSLPSLSTKARVIIVVACIVAALVIAMAAVLHWNHYYRYDDHADMQGSWYVDGSVVTIAINEDTIRFNDDVAYSYSIDDHDKTIDVSFAKLSGTSYYDFSSDRQHLVIASADSELGKRLASGGIASIVDEFNSLFGSGDFQAPEGDGVVSLGRQPSVLATLAKQTRDQMDQKKAIAEQNAQKAAQEAALAEEALEDE